MSSNYSAPADVRVMLAIVLMLIVCGYCSAQCSTTPPVGLTVPEILYQPYGASYDSKFSIVVYFCLLIHVYVLQI